MFRLSSPHLLLIVILFFLSLTRRDVEGQPTLDEPLRDMIGTVGGSIIFECSVRNLNAYNILWAKDASTGSYISRNEDLFDSSMNSKYALHRDESTFQLEILNLQMEDEGTYECLYESSFAMSLGSATLSVIEIYPMCDFVTVPVVNELVVDLNCSWSNVYPDATATVYRNGAFVSPDFTLRDRVITRQTLTNIGELSEFECQWTSPTTTQTTTCSYHQSSQAPMSLGVEPYVNSVVAGQTARFECLAEISTSISSDITYSWSLMKDGVVTDLGERQKGFMKQAMKILDTDLNDDGMTVVCTAKSPDGIAQGVGQLVVRTPTTSLPTSPTKSMTTAPINGTTDPRTQPFPISNVIMVVIGLLMILIIGLVILIIVLWRSKTKQAKWLKFGRGISLKRHRSAKPESTPVAAYPNGGSEMLYPDPNPDIIRSHSTSTALPLYAMPDKFLKASTLDGMARYPPRHYLPRRQTLGGTVTSETEFRDERHVVGMNDNHPNPYEDIDEGAVTEAKRIRSKSQTVCRSSSQDMDTQQYPHSASPRKYRGMKSASSLSALYPKPEKPPRNPGSMRNRKSWDQPGSLENLCTAATSDARSVKSFTISICDDDNYACVEDDGLNFEGNTMASEYMDMNPIMDDTDTTVCYSNDVSLESDLSPTSGTPIYAQITAKT